MDNWPLGFLSQAEDKTWHDARAEQRHIAVAPLRRTMPDTASAAAAAAASATAPEPLRLRRPDGVPPQLPLTPDLDLPQTTEQVPSSPPPSYEEVLAEVCTIICKKEIRIRPKKLYVERCFFNGVVNGADEVLKLESFW